MSPTINVDFSDVDSFEPLPEGQYDVEIDKVEVRENKAGDGLYLNWELIVLDGEYENRRLWMITSLKPQALFRLKQVLEDLGVTDDEDEEVELEYDDDVDPTTQSGPRLLFPEVEGLEAVAVVKNEMYDGREKNRVNELHGATKRANAKASSKSSSSGRSSSHSSSSRERDSGSRRRRVR